ncbi:hypothetical protein Tco_0986512, partial [Tanacetum coccineum]
LNSMSLDDAIESGEINPDKVLRKRHYDKDQYPPAGSDKERKRSRKRKDAEPPKKSSKSNESSKGTTSPKTSKIAKSMTVEESVVEPVHKQPPRPKTPDPEWTKDLNANDAPEQTWFNDMMSAVKDLLTFDDLISTPFDFSKFAMNRLKIDKLTKANLVGPVNKLLKGTCRSSVELEYNIEQCYPALPDQLDLVNPKGNRCPHDMSKTLPLQDKEGRLTIPVEFFFNNDLGYLKAGNKERKYTTSITKTKAARYELEGDEFLQYILDLYFKYFKLSEDVVNRILQVILNLQHFKSSLLIFAANCFSNPSSQQQ